MWTGLRPDCESANGSMKDSFSPSCGCQYRNCASDSIPENSGNESKWGGRGGGVLMVSVMCGVVLFGFKETSGMGRSLEGGHAFWR